MRGSALLRVRRVTRRRGEGGNVLASAGTVFIHGAAAVALIVFRGGPPKYAPPVYKVELVAAPAAQFTGRKAPEAVQRPAESAVAVAKKPPEKAPVKKAPPPPKPARTEPKTEAAPRTTPREAPMPGAKPSTGSDVATVKTGGVDFPYPEYLRNLVAQVYRRWERPEGNVSLRAEVLFFVHRDGSVSNLQFVRRSGDFGFDLQAQGAVESAANSGAFGKLPDGFDADILPVSFFFDPQTVQ